MNEEMEQLSAEACEESCLDVFTQPLKTYLFLKYKNQHLKTSNFLKNFEGIIPHSSISREHQPAHVCRKE